MAGWAQHTECVQPCRLFTPQSLLPHCHYVGRLLVSEWCEAATSLSLCQLWQQLSGEAGERWLGCFRAWGGNGGIRASRRMEACKWPVRSGPVQGNGEGTGLAAAPVVLWFVFVSPEYKVPIYNFHINYKKHENNNNLSWIVGPRAHLCFTVIAMTQTHPKTWWAEGSRNPQPYWLVNFECSSVFRGNKSHFSKLSLVPGHYLIVEDRTILPKHHLWSQWQDGRLLASHDHEFHVGRKANCKLTYYTSQ